ncbi:MAG: hypothetical protein AAF939_17480, partial [Planctomycetota bacterium]
MSEPDSDFMPTKPEDNAFRKRKRKRGGFRLFRLALKELRETLRDRRTIVTLILMPLLVYPVLSLVFKTFLLSNIGLVSTDKITLRIGVDGNASN